MDWFFNNLGTIVISIILLIAVVLIICRLRKDRKAGKSSCGCNCANCAMHGKCHSRR
mgnify:FL=1